MKSTDTRLDAVYGWADRLMRGDRTDVIDAVLGKLRSNDIDVLLGFLVSTLPVKRRLRNRGRIYEMVKALDSTPGLLEGLEP